MLRELLGSDIMGGNMRLGAFPCVIEEDSLAYRIYGKKEISERHRHRYEFNREYEKVITSYGMRFTGNPPDRNFAEIVELPDHPWFLGCQFHPEFKSKPFLPIRCLPVSLPLPMSRSREGEKFTSLTMWVCSGALKLNPELVGDSWRRVLV